MIIDRQQIVAAYLKGKLLIRKLEREVKVGGLLGKTFKPSTDVCVIESVQVEAGNQGTFRPVTIHVGNLSPKLFSDIAQIVELQYQVFTALQPNDGRIGFRSVAV
jgi:hypothetical protein